MFRTELDSQLRKAREGLSKAAKQHELKAASDGEAIVQYVSPDLLRSKKLWGVLW
jgi:hypothetical protein